MGALAAGLVGGGIARIGGVGTATGALLGACGAALAAAPAGLAVGGAVAEGGWVWRGAPGSKWRLALALAVGGAAVAGPVLAFALVLAIGAGSGGRPAGAAVAVLAAGWACALVAGALVPWQRDGAAEQAGSLAAFGLVVGVVSVGLPRVGVQLEALGLPAIAIGTFSLVLLASAGVALLARSLRTAY